MLVSLDNIVDIIDKHRPEFDGNCIDDLEKELTQRYSNLPNWLIPSGDMPFITTMKVNAPSRYRNAVIERTKIIEDQCGVIDYNTSKLEYYTHETIVEWLRRIHTEAPKYSPSLILGLIDKILRA